MSKPVISALLVGILAVGGVPIAFNSATAADLAVPAYRAAAAQGCGSCGCLHVSYVHHRELRSTYGIGFDPRNYDGDRAALFLWAHARLPTILGCRRFGAVIAECWQ